jgi:hypothetical protein
MSGTGGRKTTKGSCEEPKGLRNIRAFITADALLAAILLVWAQLWIQPSLQLWGRFYNPACGNIGDWFDRFNSSVGFGIAWTYFAVLLALSALAWAGWKTLATPERKTSDTAIGLFAASLVMGLINVIQSFFMATFKLFTDRLIFESLVPDGLKWFLLMIIPIVWLSIWGVCWLNDRKLPRWVFRCRLWRYLPWYIESVILLIAAVFASLLFLGYWVK